MNQADWDGLIRCVRREGRIVFYCWCESLETRCNCSLADVQEVLAPIPLPVWTLLLLLFLHLQLHCPGSDLPVRVLGFICRPPAALLGHLLFRVWRWCHLFPPKGRISPVRTPPAAPDSQLHQFSQNDHACDEYLTPRLDFHAVFAFVRWHQCTFKVFFSLPHGLKAFSIVVGA